MRGKKCSVRHLVSNLLLFCKVQPSLSLPVKPDQLLHLIFLFRHCLLSLLTHKSMFGESARVIHTFTVNQVLVLSVIFTVLHSFACGFDRVLQWHNISVILLKESVSAHLFWVTIGIGLHIALLKKSISFLIRSIAAALYSPVNDLF